LIRPHLPTAAAMNKIVGLEIYYPNEHHGASIILNLNEPNMAATVQERFFLVLAKFYKQQNRVGIKAAVHKDINP
jgi:hypothetical protein